MNPKIFWTKQQLVIWIHAKTQDIITPNLLNRTTWPQFGHNLLLALWITSMPSSPQGELMPSLWAQWSRIWLVQGGKMCVHTPSWLMTNLWQSYKYLGVHISSDLSFMWRNIHALLKDVKDIDETTSIIGSSFHGGLHKRNIWDSLCMSKWNLKGVTVRDLVEYGRLRL